MFSKNCYLFTKKTPRVLKRLKFKVSFTYLFKVIVDKYLLVYNQRKVSYDVTRRQSMPKFVKPGG